MGHAAEYDIVTVGGGLGGAAFGKAMAQHGARVLVLERERRFSDRVRGELMQPWGVAEARALGLYDLLCAACAHPLRWNDMSYCGRPIVHRDLAATTAPRAPWLAFYHPTMQEVVLGAAEAAGAEVRRGVRVRRVEAGATPVVEIEVDGVRERIAARLVVAADGRTSTVRKQAGFEVRRDPPRLLFSGVLLDDVRVSEDAGQVFFNPDIGRLSLLFPQGGGRVRAYVSYHKDADPPRATESTLRRFFDESVRAGVDGGVYAHTRAAGPLATFDAADAWVDHPYRDGVALIGDAAATSDPTWGEGMSLTLRDVRTLCDRLLQADDWVAAGHAYAEEHDRYYGIIHEVDGWFAEFFMEIGAEAQARRARALPLIVQDETRIPDVPFSGPEMPADGAVRRRFFGEE